MRIYFIICSLLFVAAENAVGQMPLLDRGVQVEGLWCFPLFGDTLKYVYLPNEGMLAQGRDSLPQFSYMRYVLNTPAGNNTGTAGTIGEADGGAIINFLSLYNTSQATVDA